MSNPARVETRLYLFVLAGISVFFIISIAATNYLVDPYFMHAWGTHAVERRQGFDERLSAWGKTYAVAKYKPNVVYIGSSRTEVGLPTATPYFPGRKVFNAAVSGSSLGDSILMARHAAGVGDARVVVWGIDYFSFTMKQVNSDFDHRLVGTNKFYLWSRIPMDIERYISMDAMQDTWSILTGHAKRECHSSLMFFGQRDERCMDLIIQSANGTGHAVESEIKEVFTSASDAQQSAQALSAFGDVTAMLCAKKTKLRFYINATHAISLQEVAFLGRWRDMENWQRDVTQAVAGARARGCDVRLYDYSGYNIITTEPLPQSGGNTVMKYYWDASHVRASVGQWILARMFDMHASRDNDFGHELTSANLENELALNRIHRDRFTADHPELTSLLQCVLRHQCVTIGAR